MTDAGSIYRDAQLVIWRGSDFKSIALEGDLDYWNGDAVTEALADLGIGKGEVLTIDLTSLKFCDVSGIRVLVMAATRLASDRRLVLTGLPPRLRRAIDLVDWGASPGLEVEPELP